MLKTTVSAAALAAASFAITPAQAEIIAEPTSVNEIIVTASRIGLEEREIGSAFTVRTEEDIKEQQIIFLKDMLADMPGIQITSDRPGGYNNVSIRGSSNDEVLFLIDGIELGDPSSTSTQYSTEHLTSGDVSRMEVLRGNQSSLYGSDAIGGVVNIITKRATREGLEVNAEAETGSHGTLSGGVSLLGRYGDLDFRVTATAYEHDGPSLAAPIYGPTPEKDAYERKGVSGRIGYQLTDNIEAQLIGFYTDTATDLDNTGSDNFNTVDKDEAAFAGQIKHRNDAGNWTNELTLGRYWVERLYFGAYNRPEGDKYEGFKTSLNYITSYDTGGIFKLAGGLNYEEEKTDQITNYSGNFNESIDSKSAFAEVAARPVENLSLTFAARLDDNSRFGAYDTYRVTGAYLFPQLAAGGDVKLRASLGTGAKAPGLYQLFDPLYGNTELGVEESVGSDIGVDINWENVSLEATLFQNNVEDEIVWSNGKYIQIGETSSSGFEFGLSARITDWLSVSQSYTNLVAQSEVTGLWLGRPRHSGTTSLTFMPTDKIAVTTRARYRSRNEASYGGTTDAFITLDVMGSYRINDNYELYARVVNLADENYQVSWGEQTLGRSGYVGIRASF